MEPRVHTVLVQWNWGFMPCSRRRGRAPGGPGPGASGVLQEADEVAVRVLDRGDHPSAAHVLDILVHLGAGLDERLQGALDVADVEIGDGAALARGDP